jgi:2-polyprenyl-3-methyl-5-hydroxy-6-metoxy-1,4-benzoquinol methylase
VIKRLVRRGLRRLGYDILKIPAPQKFSGMPAPPAAEPVWPLPRGTQASDEAIHREFERYAFWHYAFEFEGGLAFTPSHNDPGLDTNLAERPLQRFRHFMPYLLQCHGGTLSGKRVLDIACNSGFWSIQCALAGAKQVVGFDARPELIEQANIVRRIVGVGNVEFRVLDFWQMSPETLGGEFDIVLNLGFLYHVPTPLEALALTKRMARHHILLDTAVHPSEELALYLKWERPTDIRMAAHEGVVALPTKPAVELLLRHLKFSEWQEIPVRTRDLPIEYRTQRRASWLISV